MAASLLTTVIIRSPSWRGTSWVCALEPTKRKWPLPLAEDPDFETDEFNEAVKVVEDIRKTRPAGLRKQQSNFAGEPRRAPIKTHLTPELASNYVFYNAGAAPAMRGGAMVGPPDSVQRKLSCPPIVRDHTISTSPSAADSDPYFAALVSSSCNEIAIA
jgi:hypothetical protein